MQSSMALKDAVSFMVLARELSDDNLKTHVAQKVNVMPIGDRCLFVKEEADKDNLIGGWRIIAEQLVTNWPIVHAPSLSACTSMENNFRFAGVENGGIASLGDDAKAAKERTDAVLRLEKIREEIKIYEQKGETPIERYKNDEGLSIIRGLVTLRDEHLALAEDIKTIINARAPVVEKLFTHLKDTVDACGDIAEQDFAAPLNTHRTQLKTVAKGMTDESSWCALVGQNCNFRVLQQKTKFTLQKVVVPELNSRVDAVEEARRCRIVHSTSRSIVELFGVRHL